MCSQINGYVRTCFKCLIKRHVSTFQVLVTPTHVMQVLRGKYKNMTCLGCWKCESVLCVWCVLCIWCVWCVLCVLCVLCFFVCFTGESQIIKYPIMLTDIYMSLRQLLIVSRQLFLIKQDRRMKIFSVCCLPTGFLANFLLAEFKSTSSLFCTT